MLKPKQFFAGCCIAWKDLPALPNREAPRETLRQSLLCRLWSRRRFVVPGKLFPTQQGLHLPFPPCLPPGNAAHHPRLLGRTATGVS